MTVPIDNYRVDYVATGLQDTYGFGFKCYGENFVSVVLTDPSVSGWSVSLNADQDNNPGGTITLNEVPELDSLLTISRKQSIEQLLDLDAYGPFPAESIERVMDLLTMMISQMLDSHGGSMIGPLRLSATAENDEDAANKLYVDTHVSSQMALKVSRSGDAMGGQLHLPLPTSDTSATPRKFVSDLVKNASQTTNAGTADVVLATFDVARTTDLSDYDRIYIESRADWAPPDAPEYGYYATKTGIAGTPETGAFDLFYDALGNQWKITGDSNLPLVNEADATQALADSSVALADSSVALADSSVAQADATQALADSSVAQADATQALADSSVAQADATQALTDSSVAQADATQALTDSSVAYDLAIIGGCIQIVCDSAGTAIRANAIFNYSTSRVSQGVFRFAHSFNEHVIGVFTPYTSNTGLHLACRIVDITNTYIEVRVFDVGTFAPHDPDELHGFLSNSII